MIIQICQEQSIPIYERNISLTELYNADQVFCSGTMGELTPITHIDGRRIENRSDVDRLPVLIRHFEESIPRYCIEV